MPNLPGQQKPPDRDSRWPQLTEHYEEVIAEAGIGLMTVDRGGAILEFNGVAAQFLGLHDSDRGQWNLTALLAHFLPEAEPQTTSDSVGFPAILNNLPSSADGSLKLNGREGKYRHLVLSLMSLSDTQPTPADDSYLVVISQRPASQTADTLNQRQQALFRHITNGINAVTGEAFFTTLTEELAKALHVDFSFIGKRLDGGERIRMIAVHDPSGVAPVFDYDLHGTASEAVMEKGFRLYTRDVHEHFPTDFRLRKSSIEGYGGIELKGSDGQSLGLIAILHSKPILEPQLAEYLLHIFASRAASELERQIQQEQLKQNRRTLIQRNKDLALINNLSLQLHGSRSIEAIIQETLDAIVTLSQSSHVAFYLKGPEPWLTLADARGFDSELRNLGKTLPMENSLSAYTIQTEQVAVVNDLTRDLQMNPAVREGLIRKGYLSAAIVPLIYDHQLFGSVNIIDRYRRVRGQEEISTLAALGRTVSLALSNIRRTEELTHLAEHDSLSGLPNRIMLHRELDRLGQNVTEDDPHNLSALLLLDLDRFKEINDTLGHHVGDQLLQQIGPRLDSALTGSKYFLCRLGGDEFSVLITDLADESEAYYWASRILKTLGLPYQIEHMQLEVGTSIGMTLHPTDGHDKHELLRMADVAMYSAKHHGGGLARYDRDSDVNTPERLGLLSELGTAIRTGDLVLHYQPKINLEDHSIIGFEALVRWQHPQRGLLYPDQFMPQAEISEIIHQLTESVIRLALQQQQRWRNAGHHHDIAINLSARNLVDDRCIATLQQLLQQYETQPETVELEITETALMQDPDGAAELLRQIAAIGIRLSIDDFGSGYSSLGYLRHLPIHHLKIDRTFVKDMLSNPQDAIIVRSTIGLAHNLGLKVIAEGVEDDKTLHALHAMSCDSAQGYFIGKPRPAEDWFQEAHG